MKKIDRRQFLTLAGLGGVAFASALHPLARAAAAYGGSGKAAAQDDFYFVQLSDTHWGFNGPAVNPDAQGTLPKAVAAVNALPQAPDFVIFFFFSSRRRHTRCSRDWSSDVCSSDLGSCSLMRCRKIQA